MLATGAASCAEGEHRVSCGGSFYEFFAGGGMARAGLGAGWTCLFANDFDHKKASAYERNWGGEALLVDDIYSVTSEDLPGHADLAWASFPCQDLSLAGGGAGLRGDRSGTFWPFWKLTQRLVAEGRAPRVVVLENVPGTLTSHGGKDFAALCSALREGGYRCGAMVLDAALFVPQSRPRLFIVGLRREVEVPLDLLGDGPTSSWHTKSLVAAYERLPANDADNWIWWSLPHPPNRTTRFVDLVEEDPSDVDWHSPDETNRLLDMMSETNLAKVERALGAKRPVVGTLYKRTRPDGCGVPAQRAEVRFDGVAGCLRTPAGGSSRQLVVVVQDGSVRSRLISRRETARLMGLPDSYELPERYNEAYHLTGDGVVVPVVRHLAEYLIEPILASLGGSSGPGA